MKTLTFKVSLTFTEDIKESELLEVTKNLSDGIYNHWQNGNGFAPEESAAYTKSIIVKETHSGSSIKHNINNF